MESQRNCVLVVDDDRDVARSHGQILEKIGYRSIVQSDPTKVEATLEQTPDIDMVLLDIRMPHLSGLELLQRIKLRRPAVGVVMATVINDIEQAVKAIKSGAYNYLLKPLQIERLEDVLKQYYANQPRSLIDDPRFAIFVTKHQAFQEIFRRVKTFAETDVTVLIEGETGTGKELIAQLIHSVSARPSEQFLAVNVAAVSSALFESELFGHCKGAFTGAINDHAGYFQSSGAGTLFLDEIGEMDLEHQKKLLRVIQTRRYSRIGESTEREISARLVLATNCDLKSATAAGRFREDLYYRLSSYCVHLPPLRERTGDVEVLALYFLRKYCSQFGRSIENFHPDTMDILNRYPFPGNVRELEGIVSGAVLIEQETVITPSALPDHIKFADVNGDDLETVRFQTIVKTLAMCDGNQTKAAEKLGISRGTLNRIVQDYRKRGHNI